MGTVPDIKLIRTDTTLDHSQEAEKQRRKNFTVPTGNSLIILITRTHRGKILWEGPLVQSSSKTKTMTRKSD